MDEPPTENPAQYITNNKLNKKEINTDSLNPNQSIPPTRESYPHRIEAANVLELIRNTIKSIAHSAKTDKEAFKKSGCLCKTRAINVPNPVIPFQKR